MRALVPRSAVRVLHSGWCCVELLVENGLKHAVRRGVAVSQPRRALSLVFAWQKQGGVGAGIDLLIPLPLPPLLPSLPPAPSPPCPVRIGLGTPMVPAASACKHSTIGTVAGPVFVTVSARTRSAGTR